MEKYDKMHNLLINIQLILIHVIKLFGNAAKLQIKRHIILENCGKSPYFKVD